MPYGRSFLSELLRLLCSCGSLPRLFLPQVYFGQRVPDERILRVCLRCFLECFTRLPKLALLKRDEPFFEQSVRLSQCSEKQQKERY